MSTTLDIQKLAHMIKAKRGNQGLRAVAEEIDGISASTLSRIEQGNLPDIETFLRLCQWLEVKPDFFTKKSDKKSESTTAVLAAHLRADRTLSEETAEALIQMISLAYQNATGKRGQRA
jgi:transcriptional regulator with XRE-family HTH domain